MTPAESARQRLAAGGAPVAVHPLGFACAQIQPGLCVHCWLPGEPELEPVLETSPVHCHRWNLSSRVLAGEVGNTVWTAYPTGRLYASHRVYDIRVTPDADVIRPTGRYVRATPGIPTFAEVGDTYTLPAGVFHASIIAGLAVTLLTAVREPGVRDRALGSLIPPATRVTRRRDASPALAARVTRLALRHLESYQAARGVR